MSRRRKLIIAGVVVALGIILLVASVVSAQSPSGYIKDHYKRIGTDQGADLYASSKSATDTAKDIANAIKPADRLATPSGDFAVCRVGACRDKEPGVDLGRPADFVRPDPLRLRCQ
jgi:hypothetical protein